MSQSKTSKEAMEAFDASKQDAVPAAEHGDHAKSHAAHTEVAGKAHTSPEGYGKQGREPGTLTEPAQDPKRNGKTHNWE